jgi:hypothetical protein
MKCIFTVRSITSTFKNIRCKLAANVKDLTSNQHLVAGFQIEQQKDPVKYLFPFKTVPLKGSGQGETAFRLRNDPFGNGIYSR